MARWTSARRRSVTRTQRKEQRTQRKESDFASWLLRLSGRQTSLERFLDRFVDRNADDARVLVHPPVGAERLVLARAQVGEILARVGLQPRLGRHAAGLRRRERILRRRLPRLAAVEIPEQLPDGEVDEHADDDQRDAEGEDAADVDVA